MAIAELHIPGLSNLRRVTAPVPVPAYKEEDLYVSPDVYSLTRTHIIDSFAPFDGGADLLFQKEQAGKTKQLLSDEGKAIASELVDMFGDYDTLNSNLKDLYKDIKARSAAGEMDVNTLALHRVFSSARMRSRHKARETLKSIPTPIVQAAPESIFRKIRNKAALGLGALALMTGLSGSARAPVSAKADPQPYSAPTTLMQNPELYDTFTPLLKETSQLPIESFFTPGESMPITLIYPDGKTEVLGEITTEFNGSAQEYLTQTGNQNPGPEAINGLSWLDYGDASYGLAHTASQKEGEPIKYGPFERVRQLIESGELGSGFQLQVGKDRVAIAGYTRTEAIEGGLITLSADDRVKGKTGLFLCQGFEVFDPVNQRLGPTKEWAFIAIEPVVGPVARVQSHTVPQIRLTGLATGNKIF